MTSDSHSRVSVCLCWAKLTFRPGSAYFTRCRACPVVWAPVLQGSLAPCEYRASFCFLSPGPFFPATSFFASRSLMMRDESRQEAPCFQGWGVSQGQGLALLTALLPHFRAPAVTAGLRLGLWGISAQEGVGEGLGDVKREKALNRACPSLKLRGLCWVGAGKLCPHTTAQSLRTLLGRGEEVDFKFCLGGHTQ